MVSTTVGYMVGSTGDAGVSGMLMQKTTDGGATWSPMTPPFAESWKYLTDVQFADASTGWIVGGNGVLYKTTDGGETWVYESNTSAWLYSISAASPSAAWAGTSAGGILTNTPAPVPYVPITVYRFYNLTNGTHFYTASAEEADHVIATWPTVYRYEGVGYAYNGANAHDPLYRFYNRKSGSHFYTVSAEEADHVIATWPDVFTYEGIAYNVSKTPVAGGTVYRFYNLKNGSHFFTASAEERDMVIATWPAVFRYEGEAYYLPM
jgi:hypothetical protein